MIRAAAGCMAAIMALCTETAALSGAAYSPLAEGIEPVEITDDTFPDDNFREYVSDTFDTNHDKTLDPDEILVARNIWCDNMEIQSLEGIGHLVELRGLYCRSNNITSLNLSKNKQLTGVWCSDNPLTRLDFSGNPELVWVYCFDCDLVYLNVSKNEKMAYIECNTNPRLSSLNVRNNQELEHLMCGSCNLSKLDISQNSKLTHLDAFNNKLTTLDVSNNTKLKRLDIWENAGLGSIDVSNNPDLQYYNCSANDAASVDVSKNLNLEKLSCGWNDLTELNVSNNPKLVYLDCNTNAIKKLDVSNNPKLFFLQAFINDFTDLDISNCPDLIRTYQNGVTDDVYGLATEWLINYGEDLKYFLCFDNKVKLKGGDIQLNEEDEPFEYTDVSDTKTPIKREEVIQALYELAGKPKVNTTKTRFNDVPADSPYRNAIIWGEKNNICFGFPDISCDSFGMGKWVTREDAAFMLYKYSVYADLYSSMDYGRTDDFSDYFDIDYYAWEAVTWAIQWEILIPKGPQNEPNSQRRIAPHATISRTELESMINAMMELNEMAPVYTQKPGDVNGSGSIDLDDIKSVKKHLKKTKVLTGAQLTAADANRDGVVDTKDISAMKAHMKGTLLLW